MNQDFKHIVCPACAAINRVARNRPASQAKCGNCHKPLFTGTPTPVNAQQFERHITRNDIPVIVDFWAQWCGPCHMMAPAFEGAATALEPDYRLLKLNTEEEQDIAARYNIRSIPMLMMFAHGKLVAQNAGTMDTNSIVNWSRSHATMAA